MAQYHPHNPSHHHPNVPNVFRVSSSSNILNIEQNQTKFSNQNHRNCINNIPYEKNSYLLWIITPVAAR